MPPGQKPCLFLKLHPSLEGGGEAGVFLTDASGLGTMQVTHLSARRGAVVFPATLAEFIPHRHLNVQHSPAFCGVQ